MTNHMVELTRELLREGRTRANSHGNQHRWKAAAIMTVEFADVLDTEELEGEYGSTDLVLTRAIATHDQDYGGKNETP